MPVLRFLRNIAGYALVATIFLSPIGWALLIMLLFIKTNDWCLNTWLLIDKLACNLCHGTGLNRTISGYTGQHIHKRRYKIQARFIDSFFGDSHCINTFKDEVKMGWVRNEYQTA